MTAAVVYSEDCGVVALPKPIKRCGCGREYSREDWDALRFVGYQRPPGAKVLELRECHCHSTIAIDVTDEPLRVGRVVLPRLFPALPSSRRWGAQVELERWHGRIEIRSTSSIWWAEVVCVEASNRRQVRVEADAKSPDLALANAIELTRLGDEFLAAFGG